MKTNILRNVFLALAAMAYVGTSAQAQLLYNDKDILVAFSNSNGSHTGNTYLANIGSVDNFLSGGAFYNPSVAVVVNSGSASGYLTDISTAGLTVGTSYWGAFGLDITNFNGDIWLSKQNGTSAIPDGGAFNAANNMGTMIFTATDPTDGAVTVSGSYIQNTGDTNSYGSYNFGTNSPVQSWGNYAFSTEAATSSALDLYALTEGGAGLGTKLGTFNFNASNGQISFTAIPEPSTYALIGLGLGSLVLLRRYNSKKAVTA